uniref:Uncharacterized protein n=1 Tax=Yersinia enterocolitica W22703 TaxID=913028 RepID=F4N384_YEREN|nr:unknown protein [Yersinia enterocolitica W22703]
MITHVVFCCYCHINLVFCAVAFCLMKYIILKNITLQGY